MGWRRENYEKIRLKTNRKKLNYRSKFNDAFNQGLSCSDICSGRYIFPRHIFDSYFSRVTDPNSASRTELEIADILAHCLDHTSIPDKLVRHLSTNVLVDLHTHQNSSENSFGLYYIPLRRESADSSAARIVAVTILGADELFYSKNLLI